MIDIGTRSLSIGYSNWGGTETARGSGKAPRFREDLLNTRKLISTQSPPKPTLLFTS